ncbi:11674_t:CDS:2, partial [Gigaspora rosea]
IIANWCCHCGYILPLGKKGAKKCTDCGIACHSKCAHLVPDFCGMSMRRAKYRDARNSPVSQMPVITSPIPERPPGLQPAVPVSLPPKDKPDSVISVTQKVGLDDFNFLAVL